MTNNDMQKQLDILAQREASIQKHLDDYLQTAKQLLIRPIATNTQDLQGNREQYQRNFEENQRNFEENQRVMNTTIARLDAILLQLTAKG